MVRLLALLALLAAAHVVAMMALEGLGLGDAIWLTMTTLTTVGYGDLSAATPWGRLATIALLYLVGISMLAQLASDYIDYRMQRREKMIDGLWEWDMRDHLLIVNTPRNDAARYCELLIRQIRDTPEFVDTPILMLTSQFPDGLPQRLRDAGVVHRTDYPTSAEAWESVHVDRAKYVLVLAEDPSDRCSDSYTFDILSRIAERTGSNGTRVIAECVDDANRERFLRAGASTVVRPIRAYPELIVRAIVAPGVEVVMENLFTHDGDHAQRYDIELKDGTVWSDIVSALIQRDWGTAMAYIRPDGKVVCNPPAQEPVEARALLVMVREGHEPTDAEVRGALA